VTAPRPARVTMRDDSLPHQVRLFFLGRPGPRHLWVAVSCTCLRENGGSYRPLDARACWDDPDEPLRIWQAHYREVTSVLACPDTRESPGPDDRAGALGAGTRGPNVWTDKREAGYNR